MNQPVLISCLSYISEKEKSDFFYPAPNYNQRKANFKLVKLAWTPWATLYLFTKSHKFQRGKK